MTQKSLERIAVYPGTFDPFTIGHKSIVERGLKIFDKIIIAVGINDAKRCYKPTEDRVRHIKKVMADEPRVEVVSYDGLTVDIAALTMPDSYCAVSELLPTMNMSVISPTPTAVSPA